MRKKSSKIWLREHFSDTYVKQAQQAGYRSRSVYKLEELHQKHQLFKPGMKVVDLGAAPGGWSQLVAKLVGKTGRVVAIDILPMDPIAGVDFIQGDFSEDSVLEKLHEKIAGKKMDWVICDMAPNMSGIESVDQSRSMALAELALEFALQVLSTEGGFLIKVFQGEDFECFLKATRSHFKKVLIKKPKASRDRSREVYILSYGKVTRNLE